MKKKIIAVVSLLLLLTLFLTSCRVNWFDRHYDVPWWGIAVPVVIFFAVVWIVMGKSLAKKEYICSSCNKIFYPKWWNAAISIHINDDRVFKCPHCGRKGFCRPFKEE